MRDTGLIEVTPEAASSGGEAADRKRLDSWKDIATYLGRGVRTVQSWEAEKKLPVHRLRHKARYTVYAWADEVDTWLMSRSKTAPLPEEPSAAAGGREEPATAAAARSAAPQWGVVLALTGLAIAVLALVAYLQIRVGDESSLQPLVAHPFTSSPALEQGARIAPDGRLVVFTQAVEPGNPDIVLKLSESGSVVPLSATPAAEYSPTWSPDSTEVAFLRSVSEPGVQFLVVASARQGTERTVVPLRAPPYRPGDPSLTQLDWSPDGRYIIAPDSVEAGPYSIVLVNITTGEKRQLTNPPATSVGDTAVRASPDGGRLAVTRVAAEGRSEVVIYDVAANWSAVVERGRLRAREAVWNASPTWTPDGQSIVFSAGVASKTEIWAARLEALHDPHRIQAGIEAASVTDIREAEDGSWRMVYGLEAHDFDIIRIPLTMAAGRPVEDINARREAIAATTYSEAEPRISPHGTQLAYVSDRSGSQQIWVKDLAAGDPHRLTDFEDCVLSAPRWSPDGKRVLFHAIRASGARIYSVTLDGARVEPVGDRGEQFAPEWSSDGQWLYYTASQPGRRERAVYRQPLGGGESETVSLEPAQAAVDAPSGAVLIAHETLKLQRQTDPEPVPISDGPLLGYQSFDVKGGGVYYVSGSTIWFRPFAGSESYVVASHRGSPGPGLSIAPDQSAAYVVAAAVERADIMQVEDVRASLPHQGSRLLGWM